MDSYYLYARSRTLTIGLFLLYWTTLATICLVVTAVTVNVDNDAFVAPFLAVEGVLMVVAYWLAKRSARRQVKATISDDSIYIDRERKSFVIFRNLPATFFFKDLMVHEHKGGRPTKDYIELDTVEGRSIRLYRTSGFAMHFSDFDSFVTDLKAAFEQYVVAGNITAVGTVPVDGAQEEAGSQIFLSSEPMTFQLRNISTAAGLTFFCTFMLSLIIYVGVCVDSEGGLIAIFGGMGLLIAGTILLFRKTQQKMEATITGEHITIKYLQKFLLDSVRDRTFLLSDIKAYKFEDFNGCRFILYLKDGSKIKMAVGNYGNGDQISAFAQTVMALAERNNEKRRATPIEQKETFYEGTGGLVLAIFIIAVLIFAVIAIIFFPQEHQASDVVRGLGSILSGVGLCILRF